MSRSPEDQVSLFAVPTAQERAAEAWREKARMSGKAVTDEAIARVERNAPFGWNEKALRAVEEVARVKQEFTTDDLWERVGQPPEPRALGAVMRRAANKGICSATDRTIKSARVECHSRPVRVWRSELFMRVAA